ncbi:unnamed protein product [Cylicostephanus goldi]|uniref:Uncharacterized protein n=1 Tax=Cylicostephanus goldi TaxID=71465 RepID=A0A3P7MII7_CYLGO|nr:unnamed protein product [Cylicostephanus goldi]
MLVVRNESCKANKKACFRHAPYLIRLIRFIHFAIGQINDLTSSEADVSLDPLYPLDRSIHFAIGQLADLTNSEVDEADEADEVWRLP